MHQVFIKKKLHKKPTTADTWLQIYRAPCDVKAQKRNKKEGIASGGASESNNTNKIVTKSFEHVMTTLPIHELFFLYQSID